MNTESVPGAVTTGSRPPDLDRIEGCDPVATASGTALISCSTFVKTYDDKKLCFTTVGSTPSFSRRIFGVRSEKEKHCGPNHQRRNRSDDGWLAPGD